MLLNLFTVKKKGRAIVQATGHDMVPLFLLITASHLPCCPGPTKAEEVRRGSVSGVIPSEADISDSKISPVVRWSGPPLISPFPAALPLELL